MGNKWVVYTLALAVFLIGTVEYLISGIIQIVAVDLGVTTSSAGLLVTAFALSAAIGAPIIITATIYLDRKKLLLTMLGIFMLSNWLVYVSPSFEMMLVTRMIQGLSGGVATVVAMAVSTQLVEEGNRGRAIGIILMGLSSSLVLGLPVGTYLSEAIGWRLLFIFIGLLGLIPLLVIYKKVPPIKAQETVTPRAQLAVIKNKKILAAVVITLLYIGAYSTVFTYIAPFLLIRAELSASEISAILFLAGICSFMGSKIGGVIADRKGPKFSIYFGLSLQASMLLLLSVMDGVITVHIVIIMLWMLATWATSPAQQLYLVTQVPRSPDIALGINTSFIQFGFALGSWVGGLVISNASVEHLGWSGFVIALLSLLLAIRLFSLKKEKEQLSA
ncbi:MFS transporter [Brevibacillus sp. M2.1A]|uniref:MFS transporter n=1 Tax=Brevibacillus sp. M2.1A TaxID=2738980 RepID=UPI00156B2BC0|nr:MFS transporter [Brevibacillus sp. M2.1A]MCC8437676.1 MFS transporter [Brevibacillus sp. M2.1A]